MRLKSTRNRVVGDTEYRRWLISDVPPTMVKELGWEEGQKLDCHRSKDGILVTPAEPTKVKAESKRRRRK